MSKFHGLIGFGETKEIKPGVYEDVITEKRYIGDEAWDNRHFISTDNIVVNTKVNKAISILADSYLNNNFFNVRYVKWRGIAWSVSSVEVSSPRVKLFLGEVYNGPTL